MIQRPIFFVILGIAIGSVADAETNKPNILLIMADDLGFSDLGCYGSEIATPQLDAIAENGLRFTQFYNTARCWPTRAALLTGYYAQQVRRDVLPGIPSGGRGKRPDWAPLLPVRLKSAGYRSYHTGKWHIDGMPIENGFDRSYLLKDQGRFFNPKVHWRDDVRLPPVQKGTEFYATTALADHVISVLDEHSKEHSGTPFFHYLAFAAPHFPLQALPEDIAIYRDRYLEGWDSIRAKRWSRMQSLGIFDSDSIGRPSNVERRLGPPYHFPQAFEILGRSEINKPVAWNSLSDEQKKFQATKMAIHAAMIHRMDIEIGRVFDKIKELGQWENTLVIFLSDNGASAEIMVRDDGHNPNAPMGSAETYLCLGPGWSTICNTPFRRHKTWTHEGGTSTPLLVSWPKGISARGEFRREPGHVIDIVPTLCEISGASPPADSPAQPGRSLLPSIQNGQPIERDALWWFHDGNKAIRVGDWKAVAPVDEPWELYDLSTDRIESTDLAIPQSAKLKSLVELWEQKLDQFTQLAKKELDDSPNEKLENPKNRSVAMSQAQAAGKPQRPQVLLGGKSFLLNGRHAFLMAPANHESQNELTTDKHAKLQTTSEKRSRLPWIFYGPTLPAYPDKAESWMHKRFLDAGIAIAGIDVGEAYGSPHAFPHFEALYQRMLKLGYSKKPALLGRSRGGLWISSWAIKHPNRVSGLGGIYPVYDFTTYPGVKRAATAYGLSASELVSREGEFNPIKRAAVLADADVPVFIIHGTDDKVVPIAENSAALEAIYSSKGKEDLFRLIRSEGQGHSFWEGFFTCQELVDFLINKSKEGATSE